MGSPVSALMMNYFYNMWNTIKYVRKIFRENHIIAFWRYVDDRIDFLDVIINRTDPRSECNIYQKPTASSHIYISCQSSEHKTVAIRYLINRLTTYPLPKTARRFELQTGTHITEDNDCYNQQLITVQNEMAYETEENVNNTFNCKGNWALFTCSHTEFKIITKLLKQSNMVFKMNGI
jgi:hypothetical protein